MTEFELFLAGFQEYRLRHFAGMQPIEREVADEMEVRQLENMWDEDLPCELRHRDYTCGGTVTHRLSFCAGALLICEPGAKRKERVIFDLNSGCSYCGDLCAYCWYVVPI